MKSDCRESMQPTSLKHLLSGPLQRKPADSWIEASTKVCFKKKKNLGLIQVVDPSLYNSFNCSVSGTRLVPLLSCSQIWEVRGQQRNLDLFLTIIVSECHCDQRHFPVTWDTFGHSYPPPCHLTPNSDRLGNKALLSPGQK